MILLTLMFILLEYNQPYISVTSRNPFMFHIFINKTHAIRTIWTESLILSSYSDVTLKSSSLGTQKTLIRYSVCAQNV